MPFDPFFSSKQKEHFVVSDEGRALYQKLKDMPLWQRKKTLWEWKQRPMSNPEKDARRLVSRELNTKYSYRNRTTAVRHDVKRNQAARATGTIVFKGYGTDPSAKGLTGKHGLGAK